MSSRCITARYNEYTEEYKMYRSIDDETPVFVETEVQYWTTIINKENTTTNE